MLGAEPDPSVLAVALAKQMGLPVSGGAAELVSQVEQVEALLAVKGEVHLEGVGILRRTDRGLLFGADPGLLAMINAAYQGLSEVGASTEAETHAAVPQAIPSARRAGTDSDADSSSPEGPFPSETETAPSPVEPPSVGDGVLGDAGLHAFTIGASDSPEPSALAQSIREAVREDHVAEESVPEPNDALQPPSTETVTAGLSLSDSATASPADGVSAVESGTAFSVRPDNEPTHPEEDASQEEAPDQALSTLLSVPLSTSDGAPSPSPEAEQPTIEPHRPTGNTSLEAEIPPAASLKEAASSNDTLDPETKEPDPVDALLAGIWSTGTPAAGDLGVSPVSDSLSTESPTTRLMEEARPATPLPQTDQRTSPEEAPAFVAKPRTDRGDLPVMPSGWTPSGDFDDEYEEFERPRGAMPWVLGTLAVLALVLALVFFWPRMASQSVETLEAVDAPAEAVAPLTEDPVGALDEQARRAQPVTDLERTEEAALPETDGADEPGPTQRESREIGISTAPSTLSEAPSGIPTRTPRTESSGRMSSTPRAGGNTSGSAPPAANPLAPDIAGLSDRLARALAGNAPIRLDATGFTWVVSSVSSREEAVAAVARYRRAGFRARVIDGSPGGSTMYRIAIGQFDTRQDAFAVRDRLPADIRGRDDIWTLNLADV